MAVRLALFGEQAEQEYERGDVLKITGTYKYRKTDSLSTTTKAKVEVSNFTNIYIATLAAGILVIRYFTEVSINLIAFRKAKIAYNISLSECNRVD